MFTHKRQKGARDIAKQGETINRNQEGVLLLCSGLHAAAIRPRKRSRRLLEKPVRQPVPILVEAVILLLFNPHLLSHVSLSVLTFLELATITGRVAGVVTTHLAFGVLPVQRHWLRI